MQKKNTITRNENISNLRKEGSFLHGPMEKRFSDGKNSNETSLLSPASFFHEKSDQFSPICSWKFLSLLAQIQFAHKLSSSIPFWQQKHHKNFHLL